MTEHAETQIPMSQVPHPATEHEAPNGAGTTGAMPHGATQDRPLLDGSSEYYVPEGEEKNPRYGEEDPGLVRHPETGHKTPTPNEESGAGPGREKRLEPPEEDEQGETEQTGLLE